MKLTPEEKAERARERMLAKAAEYSTGTYVNRFVAPLFQRMVRAEAGAKPAGYALAIVGGVIESVYRRIGQCVCVTCGKVGAWSSGIGGMHTGHFASSRRNAILFDEGNVAPQCSRCNRYEDGAPQRYRLWMEQVRGPGEIERIGQLKRTTRQFTREELVDLRILYKTRLDTAIAKM